MSPRLPVRRFAVNPVEVLVFSIISVVFANSLYQAFQEREAMTVAMDMKARGRSLAGTSKSGLSPTLGTAFASLETSCGYLPQQRTEARKMRFKGIVCAPTTDSGVLLEATVVNTTTQAHAQVFTGDHSDRYSTDYLALAPGTNRVRLEFRYQDGRVISRDVQIHREVAVAAAPEPAVEVPALREPASTSANSNE